MRRRSGALAAGLAVVLAVVGVVGVAAQTGGGDSNPVGSFMQRLAANLGIGEDELRAAIDKTHDEMIDDAVAQGRLTPERAEALKERDFADGLGKFERFEFHFRDGAERGAMPFAPRGLPDFRGEAFPGRGPLSMVLGPVAQAIGIDEGTLLEELVAGKSLAEIAEANGVSREQLQQRLTETFRGHLGDWLDKTLPFQMEREWRWPTPTPSGSNSGAFRGPGA